MDEYIAERCLQTDLSYPSELYSLAVEYHDLCEEYDKQVCSGKFKDGTAKPIGGKELSLVNKNAKQVFNYLLPHVENLGYTQKEFMKVISTVDFYQIM